jgi:hypothetical protein
VALAWLIAGTQTCLADTEVSPEAEPFSSDVIQLSGSVRAGIWSSSRDLDEDSNLRNGALWIKATSKPSDNYRLHAEGYVSKQDLFSNRADSTKNVLREAYADNSRGAVDLRLGKQIIAWGRADRFNPTDNLTPRDFTLLVTEDDDQRIGTPSIKADYHIDTLSITAVWLWDFQGNTVPIRQLAPGVSLLRAPVEDRYRQGALKIDQTGKAIDWSVSYFSGFDLNPDISPAVVSPPTVALKHNRIKVLGFDAATTVGRFGLRAEAAYTKTEDLDGRSPFVKNSNLYTVLGAERIFRETLTVNLQYLSRVVMNFRSVDEIPDATLRDLALTQAVISNQLNRYNHGIALRVSERWLHQTLHTEATVAYTFGQHDYVLRLKVRYAISDHWEAVLGGDSFHGAPNTFYGRLRDNSTYFAQLKFSF